MYYECFCSESFLIYSMMRFEANNIRKGKTEVVNLVHSYGRWEIKPREVKPTFPQAQKVLCQSHHQSPESLSLSPDFTVPPVILMLSYWHIFFYFFHPKIGKTKRPGSDICYLDLLLYLAPYRKAASPPQKLHDNQWQSQWSLNLRVVLPINDSLYLR